MDRLAELAKEYPDAPSLIVEAVWDLGANPRPPNSSPLGGSPYRRLLLGYYRVTYEVRDDLARVQVILVGRATRAR
jgi:mRNA-degrading endonuclease RelE of RelBE toxin-antitoxin system